MWFTGQKRIHLHTELEVASPLPNRLHRSDGEVKPPDLLTVPALKFYVAMGRLSSLQLSHFDAYLEAASVFIRYSRHVDASNPALRLNPTAYRYKDNERTSFASRIGETLSALLLEQRGYRWFAHVEDMGVSPSIPHPDFVASDARNHLVLLECKGSMRNNPIDQNKNTSGLWSGLVTPAYREQIDTHLGKPIGGLMANHGYAVGALVNDVQDAELHLIRTDTSTAGTPAPFSLVRAHYARWFRLMGEWNLASALHQGTQFNTNGLQFLMVRRFGLEFLLPLQLQFIESSFDPATGWLPPVLLWPPIWYGLERSVLERLLVILAQEPERTPELASDFLQVETATRDFFQQDVQGLLQENALENIAIFNDGAIAIGGPGPNSSGYLDDFEEGPVVTWSSDQRRFS
jgi:hypothetical protein